MNQERQISFLDTFVPEKYKSALNYKKLNSFQSALCQEV